MKIKTAGKLALTGSLLVSMYYWIKNFYHFGEMMIIYAEYNFHILHTNLYVAVENWLITSEILMTIHFILIVLIWAIEDVANSGVK